MEEMNIQELVETLNIFIGYIMMDMKISGQLSLV